MTHWTELIVELTLTPDVSLHTNLALQSEDGGLTGDPEQWGGTAAKTY